MRVRPAERGDLIAIRQVADAAHWETYDGLLKPDTIGRMLTRDYSPAALRRRLLRGGLLLGEIEGQVIAFIDLDIASDQVRIISIATEPAYRRHGVARRLVNAAQQRWAGRPLGADVLLGNLDGERFYEALGFAPGEVLNSLLFDEDVVERRWWLAP